MLELEKLKFPRIGIKNIDINKIKKVNKRNIKLNFLKIKSPPMLRNILTWF